MMHRLSRLAAPALVAAALAITSSASAQTTVAQTGTSSAPVRFGRAVVTVRASESGLVHVDVVRSSTRVGRWFSPEAIEQWAGEAEKLASAEGARTLTAPAPVGPPEAGRVEFKSPWLAAQRAGALTIDRVEKDGRAELHLFISDLGLTDDASDGHSLYVDGDAASVTQFVANLRSASERSRALAAAARASTQRAGGM